MAEPSLADQSYGHFGQPVYDVQTKSWIFGRSAINSWRLEPLGNITRTIAATKNREEEESTLRKEVERRDTRYDRALNKEIRRVVRGNPELQAAEYLLNPLIRGSEAVIAAVAKHDPAVGDILALGSAIISDGQNRHNKTQLCALPGGEGREALRMVRLQADTYGWNEGSALLLVSSPTDEVGWWVGKGAPIQQISTPEMLSQEDQGSFFAVRLPGTTLFFRPRYRATPVPPAGVHLGCTISPSRVDVNLLLEILPRDWQGQRHADVTFNPWNQYRLAIVDQAGDWAVFRVKRADKRSQVYEFKMTYRGSLDGINEEPVTREQPSSVQQDGWARVLWVADKNTLLICTRRQFCLFSLLNEAPLPFADLLSKNQWFFDVRRCPGRPNWLFILTSTQVFWLEILPESDRVGHGTRSAGRILLSAHHFRDQSDISLQMNIENDLDGIFLLLWSRNGPLVTCMRFDRQEFISGLPSVVGIPTELLLPISENGNQLSISTFSICRLNYEAKDEDTILLETSRPTIYSLQLLTDDLALHHTFLCSSQYLVPNPPHYKAKTRTPAKSAPVVLEDGFIVPDEFSQRSRKVAESGLPVLQKVKYAPSLTENKKLTGRGRTVENEIVIRKISRAMAQENQQEIIDIANELQSLVLDEDAQGIGEPSKTLFEHAQSSRPEVGELAEASEVLQDLLSLSRPGPVPDEPGLAVKQLMVPAWASAMDIPSQELNFERIYTHIIDHQLAPLANEIPSRLRLAREKLARTIAAELILSNSRLELVDSPEESQEQEDEQGAQYSLPFHPQTSGKGKERATNAHPPSSQLSNILSSQPMPTPSHSASRAVSVMSRTSTSSLPSTAAQKILSRLSRHVSIDLSTTRSNWAARPMTLLSHWDIGVDPASYSYGAKLSEIEKQRQEESMTDKQRLKAREKAERRLRRQRKEVEKAERARFGVGSSQPVVMSSQRGSQYGGSQYGSQYGGISSEPLLSSPPPMMSQISVGSSQAPPVVGSSQNPGLGRTQSQGRREDGPSKRKKRKREGF